VDTNNLTSVNVFELKVTTLEKGLIGGTEEDEEEEN
jgi:hypothetical protein